MIIAFIGGGCDGYEYSGFGLFRNVEMWAGGTTEIHFYAPFEGIGGSEINHFKASHWFGITIQTGCTQYAVSGIAFGDIEWSG